MPVKNKTDGNFVGKQYRRQSAEEARYLSALMQSGTANGGKRDAMMEPYKNVVRMHMLIFVFAFAHFARLENFAVCATV